MARRVVTKKLGEVLLERGVISPKHLEEALAYQRTHGGLLGQVLTQLGFASEEEIALALTAQYGFPYLPLENYELDDSMVRLIPEHVARQYCVIPIDRVGNALTVSMADPSNIQAIEDIEMLTNCVVQAFISTPTDVLKALERSYNHGKSEGTAH
ncbi:MAG TPA: hypothetical protein DDX89_08935 [Candidatus Omnitrophica bacterium]|nr:MAG: hypothetical protein A2Z92_01580 [Omnitrophica WOR_2 bacterium GWA2_63_20]OGX15530.1 MAG: hypothetical protein A2105_03435 [Omnitrophica WOR_2 bacterium GWF2_63_9]OGX32430.1 MAG: hypothetical protein A3E56_03900 [Omnitrophica WOR_2 bacterium RIFCSPHIGHO2_12_FULL_64_13]OGX36035.1 MAG: hypothetical protein A3B73_04000 [Omnitrophica WOR_2 bacterium RIFCSPHIGHO2_02_FULL_63_39]OGX44150.1 MAG: hypothetical protein A3I71_05790 [Omnitrophica WOR_2 bacterium RIFCSPLOWO2_02_FULL_63_16]OGX49057.1